MSGLSLGGFFGGFARKMGGGSLGTGLNPLTFNGQDKETFLEDGVLPADVSPESVYAANDRWGESEAYAILLADQSQAQQASVQNSLKAMSVRASFNEGMMRAEIQARKLQARYGKSVIQYGYQNQKTQRQFDGYSSRFHEEHLPIDF